MASAQVVEMSVTNNSPSQDFNHPDDLFQSRYVTPGFKPFSYVVYLVRHDVYPLSRQGLGEEVQGANTNYAYYDLFLDFSFHRPCSRSKTG